MGVEINEVSLEAILRQSKAKGIYKKPPLPAPGVVATWFQPPPAFIAKVKVADIRGPEHQAFASALKAAVTKRPAWIPLPIWEKYLSQTLVEMVPNAKDKYRGMTIRDLSDDIEFGYDLLGIGDIGEYVDWINNADYDSALDEATGYYLAIQIGYYEKPIGKGDWSGLMGYLGQYEGLGGIDGIWDSIKSGFAKAADMAKGAVGAVANAVVGAAKWVAARLSELWETAKRAIENIFKCKAKADHCEKKIQNAQLMVKHADAKLAATSKGAVVKKRIGASRAAATGKAKLKGLSTLMAIHDFGVVIKRPVYKAKLEKMRAKANAADSKYRESYQKYKLSWVFSLVPQIKDSTKQEAVRVKWEGNMKVKGAKARADKQGVKGADEELELGLFPVPAMYLVVIGIILVAIVCITGIDDNTPDEGDEPEGDPEAEPSEPEEGEETPATIAAKAKVQAAKASEVQAENRQRAEEIIGKPYAKMTEAEKIQVRKVMREKGILKTPPKAGEEEEEAEPEETEVEGINEMITRNERSEVEYDASDDDIGDLGEELFIVGDVNRGEEDEYMGEDEE